MQLGEVTSLANSPTWYTWSSPITVYWKATASTWSADSAVFREIKPSLELKVYSELFNKRALSTFSKSVPETIPLERR